MKNQRYAILFICALALIVSNSCRKGKATWDTNLAIPILSGALSIDNLVADSLLQTNADNSMSLVYHKQLYGFSVTNEILQIPDTAFLSTYKFDSTLFQGAGFKYLLTLGYLLQQQGLLGIFPPGSTAIFPPLTGITSPNQAVDATSFFQYADIDTGQIHIYGKNDYPVNITNAIFVLKNQSSGVVLGRDTVPLIPSGGWFNSYMDLSGKHVEGNLTIKLENMDTPGSNGQPVLIDTTLALTLYFKLEHIRFSDAVLKYPSTPIFTKGDDIKYARLPGKAEVTTAKLKTGQIRVKIINNLLDPVKLRFLIPFAYNDLGHKIDVTTTCPAGTGTTPSMVQSITDLAGYTMDYTGKNHNLYNSFYDSVLLSVDSTGIFRHVQPSDSVQVLYTFENVELEDVRGYLGDTSINVIANNINFPLFNKIKGGSLSFEKLKIGLSLSNGIGADGLVKISQLTATNTQHASSLSLVAANVINQPISINRATENPLTASKVTISVDENNSNIKDMIELLPDQMNLNATVGLNPNGNVSNHHDFFLNNSFLDVGMDLEMPLSFRANHLQLRDTLSFSLGTDPAKVTAIQSGTVLLKLDNGFPLSAQIKLVLLDANYHPVDSLFNDVSMAAGLLDNNCLVSASTTSTLSFAVNQDRMSNLKKAHYAVLNVIFDSASSSSCSSHLKIYNYYAIKASISGRFIYRASF